MKFHQFIIFVLEGDEYGIHISNVKEIMKIPILEKVTTAPQIIEGVFQLRTKVVPVIDMVKKFGVNPERNEKSRLIVLELQGMSAGIIVNEVLEVATVDKEAIKPFNEEEQTRIKNSVLGTWKMGERNIKILDAAKFRMEIFKMN